MVTLLLLIIVPLVLAFSATLYQYCRTKRLPKPSFLRYLIGLEPKLGLRSQPIFWVSVGLPILYFFGFGLIVWQQHSVDISPEGFNSFLSISTLPLGLLSLAIPFSLLVNRLHGTEQIAIQIRIAHVSSTSDLYLAHYKHFSEHIDDVCSQHQQKDYAFLSNAGVTIFKKELYKKFYPQARLTNAAFVPNNDVINRTYIQIQRLLNELTNYQQNKSTTFPNRRNCINSINNCLCISEQSYDREVHLKRDLTQFYDKSKMKDDRTVQVAHKYILFYSLLVESIWKFDDNLKPDEDIPTVVITSDVPR